LRADSYKVICHSEGVSGRCPFKGRNTGFLSLPNPFNEDSPGCHPLSNNSIFQKKKKKKKKRKEEKKEKI
jgi:hypothetical protein